MAACWSSSRQTNSRTLRRECRTQGFPSGRSTRRAALDAARDRLAGRLAAHRLGSSCCAARARAARSAGRRRRPAPPSRAAARGCLPGTPSRVGAPGLGRRRPSVALALSRSAPAGSSPSRRRGSSPSAPATQTSTRRASGCAPARGCREPILAAAARPRPQAGRLAVQRSRCQDDRRRFQRRVRTSVRRPRPDQASRRRGATGPGAGLSTGPGQLGRATSFASCRQRPADKPTRAHLAPHHAAFPGAEVQQQVARPGADARRARIQYARRGRQRLINSKPHRARRRRTPVGLRHPAGGAMRMGAPQHRACASARLSAAAVGEWMQPNCSSVRLP